MNAEDWKNHPPLGGIKWVNGFTPPTQEEWDKLCKMVCNDVNNFGEIDWDSLARASLNKNLNPPLNPEEDDEDQTDRDEEPMK